MQGMPRRAISSCGCVCLNYPAINLTVANGCQIRPTSFISPEILPLFHTGDLTKRALARPCPTGGNSCQPAMILYSQYMIGSELSVSHRSFVGADAHTRTSCKHTQEPTRSPTAKITTTTWAGLDHVTRTTTAALPGICTGCKQGTGPEKKFGQCRAEIVPGWVLCQKYTPGTTECPDRFDECDGGPSKASNASTTTAAQGHADATATIARTSSADTIATTVGAPEGPLRNATGAPGASRNSTAAATVSARPSTVWTEEASETVLTPEPLGATVTEPPTPGATEVPTAAPLVNPSEHLTTAGSTPATTDGAAAISDLAHSCPNSATATPNTTLGAVLCRCAQPDSTTPEPAEPARTDCIGPGTSCKGSATVGWYWFDGECGFCFCAAPYSVTRSSGVSTPRIGRSPTPSRTTSAALPDGGNKPSAEVATTTNSGLSTKSEQSESGAKSSGAGTVVVIVVVILVLVVLSVMILTVVRRMTKAPVAATATNELNQVGEAAASGMTNNPLYLTRPGMAQLDNAAPTYEQGAPSWMHTAGGARGAIMYGMSHRPLDQDGYVAEMNPGPSRLLDSQGYVLDRDIMPAGQTGQPAANKEAWRDELMPSSSTMLDNQGYVLDRDALAPAHAAVYSVPMEVEQIHVEGPSKDRVLYCVPIPGSRVEFQDSADVNRVGPGEAAPGEPLSDCIEVNIDAGNGQSAERTSSA